MSTIHILMAIGVALIAFAVSTAFHEAAHWLMCQFLGCRVLGMKVLFLNYDGKRWTFRLRGKNHCAFATDDNCKMRTIVAAGPLTEIVIALICLLIGYWTRQPWLRIGLLCGAALIVISVIYGLLPGTDGDGKMLFQKGKE